MPIYAYRCDSCGAEQDAFRTVGERDSAPTCDCGHQAVRELLGGFGTIRSRNDTLTIDQMKELNIYKGALAHKGWLETPQVQEKLKTGRMDVETRGPRELIPKLPVTGRYA